MSKDARARIHALINKQGLSFEEIKDEIDNFK